MQQKNLVGTIETATLIILKQKQVCTIDSNRNIIQIIISLEFWLVLGLIWGTVCQRKTNETNISAWTGGNSFEVMADKVASESWIEGIQAKAEWGLGSKTTDCDSRTEGVKMERLNY